MISLGLLAIAAISISASTPQPTEIQTSGDNQSPPANYQTPTDSHPSLIAEPNGHERQNANRNQSTGKNAFLSWCKQNEGIITLGSTFFVALFTGILTLYTVKLWKSGEKHSERELRAYVGITDASITKSVDPVKSLIKAQITIRNAGQTPAYDFNLITTFDFHEIPRTEFAPYQSEIIRQSRGTLEPGAEVVVPLIADKILLAEQLQAIRDEKFAFFFYGKIKYKDAFGKDRFRDFRYIAGNDKSGSLTWQVCEEGNHSN
jgi:hypothetical protein